MDVVSRHAVSNQSVNTSLLLKIVHERLFSLPKICCWSAMSVDRDLRPIESKQSLAAKRRIEPYRRGEPAQLVFIYLTRQNQVKCQGCWHMTLTGVTIQKRTELTYLTSLMYNAQLRQLSNCEDFRRGYWNGYKVKRKHDAERN